MNEEVLFEAVKTLKEGLSKISEQLSGMIAQLNMILEYQASARPKTAEQLMDKSGQKHLADVTILDDVVTIDPLETLQIKAEDPAVRNFLLPSILDRLKEKKGVEYYLETRGELLRRVVLKKLPEGEWEKVKSAVRWAFEKAGERTG